MQKVWQCCALSIVLHFVLLSYNLINCQNWLVDHILPPDYDANQVPIESSDTLLIVNNTVQLRSLSADQDQRVSYLVGVTFYLIINNSLVTSH